MMKSHSCQRGFSLIELLIVFAIVAILAALATPSVFTWLQNSRTRSVAESVQNGLRFAQSEAARQSRFTTFTPAAGTTSWSVDSFSADLATTTHLQSSPSQNVAGVVITPGAAATTVIEFNAFGRPLGSATATAGSFAPLTAQATFDVTNSNGTRRSRVIVSTAGKIRMCDPDKTFSDMTPDGC